MKWALLSVWDKTNIIDLARMLTDGDIFIISSGGTGKVLKEAGIRFTEVSEYTGFPEMMDGRVKTLHPKIHGGILGRRGIDDAVMHGKGIEAIDLVVVNLYPFEEMVAKNLPLGELVEYIDIGGPALIRAAAKNFRDVAVVIDPEDYPLVNEAVSRGGFTDEERLMLAKKVFARTAAYDAAISNHLYGYDRPFPETYTIQFKFGRTLRYGENPHQIAAIYGERGIAAQQPLQGKIMSYNNYLDVNAATGLLSEFQEPCSVVVKHNNPCGVAIGNSLVSAYIRARDADPASAYGSIVALNGEVGRDLAAELCTTFVEVVVAPSFSSEALEIMKAKENMRVLLLPELENEDEIRTINGGALVQRTPSYTEYWEVVSDRDPDARELRAMELAWKVCKHTRSNSIVFADEKGTIGIGAGQMSRVDAAKIAILKANRSLAGSAVASDAFLPFPDTLEAAAAAGATALVQPGGSIRDKEVIDAANRRNFAMIFTGIRHFRH